jgi:dTDP-4-dehydrorhamnose 3,5-epimerase
VRAELPSSPRGQPPAARATKIPGAEILALSPQEDDRGSLTELIRDCWFPDPPVQWNVVRSVARTLRGLHWHNDHHDLISVVAGRVLVALVDLRVGSPAEGAVELVDADAASPAAVWIPPGVAHGFLSLEDSVVMYGVTDYYDPADEFGVRFDDPALGISWPPIPDRIVLSARDAQFPTLTQAASRPVWKP